MSIAPALPSYTEVSNVLKKSPSKFNASQVHGLLCGLLCATSGQNNTHWEDLVLSAQKGKKDQEVLHQVYETSYHLMNEFSFEFTLLLPSDNKDINYRTEALGLWCQGFLAGLKQAHVRITHREPGEVTDALNDITEIAQVSYGDILPSDEEETAYFELVEYVRLAILMLFHELQPDNSLKDSGETDLLH